MGAYDKRGKLVAKQIKENITNNINNANVENINEESFPVIVTYSNGHKYGVSSKGEIIENLFTTNELSDLVESSVDEANSIIGKNVKYNVDGLDGAWQVLYVGANNTVENNSLEKHIYLISSMGVDLEKLNLLYTNTNPSSEFVTNLLENDELYPAAKEWLSQYIKYIKDNNLDNNNNNIKATLSLLDYSKWTTDKWLKNTELNTDYTSKVKYVIGSPTIEMLALSYNATNDNKNFTYSIGGVYGYRASVKCYVSSNNVVNLGFDYWTASPCINQDNMATAMGFFANGEGIIRSRGYGNTAFYRRPVICLNSDRCLGANYDNNGNIESFDIF